MSSINQAIRAARARKSVRLSVGATPAPDTPDTPPEASATKALNDAIRVAAGRRPVGPANTEDVTR